MFRLCGGDQRYARWMSGRFLKKATEKLPDRLAVKSPINPNLPYRIKIIIMHIERKKLWKTKLFASALSAAAE
jgi:hypothetical protein